MWRREVELIVWLWTAVKGRRARLVLDCALGISRIALSLSFVYLCKHIVDIATGSAQGDIRNWTFILVLYIFMQLLITLVGGRIKERNRIDITNLLQEKIFAKAISSRWDGRDRFHTGDVVSRLSEDIRAVSSTVTDQLPRIVLALFQLLLASLVLFSFERKLLWVLLVIMPIAIVVSKVYFRRLRTLTDKVRQQEGSIQSHISENLLKRILVICMNRVDDAILTLSKMQGQLRETVVTRSHYTTRANMFIQAGFLTGYGVTFCWGAYGIMAGTVTYGMMTAFLQLVNQVQLPIVNMSRALPGVIQSFSSIDRLKEIDDAQSIKNSAFCILNSELDFGVRINNLTYTYPGNPKPTLSNLSLDFKPGDHVAVVGQTGAGKSTLIRILLGLLEPEKGSVEVYDSQGSVLKNGFRQLFCYVPQGNSLMSGTIRDNLLLGNPNATEAEMVEVLHLAAADFVFERENGLEISCAEQGNGLSEGQAQRIAIARALLQPGKIYLFDEACSALDDDTEARILDNIETRLKGKTLIWITHDESVMKRMQTQCIIHNA